jgi:hypothetical protein
MRKVLQFIRSHRNESNSYCSSLVKRRFTSDPTSKRWWGPPSTPSQCPTCCGFTTTYKSKWTPNGLKV